MYLSSILTFLFLLLHPIFAHEYYESSFGSSLEVRTSSRKSSTSSSTSKPAKSVDKPLPALPKEKPASSPSRSSSTKSTSSHTESHGTTAGHTEPKAKSAAAAPPSRSSSQKSTSSRTEPKGKSAAAPLSKSSSQKSTASHAESHTGTTGHADSHASTADHKESKGKAPASGSSVAQKPYQRPNLIAEMEKKNKDKPVPAERKWYQKVGDSFKNLGKSKDQKNYDKLYGDKNPGSTPNLKKLINKEAEVTTGTTANKANLEKFQKPRYEAKLDRIKPMGDVAAAEFAIHNNKYKEGKDSIAAISQLASTAKAAGLPLRRRALEMKQQYRVQRRNVLRARAVLARRELLKRALYKEEELWS